MMRQVILASSTIVALMFAGAVWLLESIRVGTARRKNTAKSWNMSITIMAAGLSHHLSTQKKSVIGGPIWRRFKGVKPSIKNSVSPATVRTGMARDRSPRHWRIARPT